MSELEKKLEDALRKSVVELKKARQKLDTLDEPIAIIGMSCRLPGGVDSPEDFWNLLINKTDGISEVPPDRWDINAYYDPDPDAPGKMSTRNGGFIHGIGLFDPDFFRMSPKEARNTDPQQRLLLEKTWEALERAGIAPATLENSETGVFIGASFSEYSELMLVSGAEKFETYSSIGGALSALNGRISYTLGLRGPSMMVDTACSSSLTSLHLACSSLQRGECNLAIAGGVNLLLLPDGFILLSRAKMLAPDGHCKTFDASGDGYARGEGVGVLILKRLSEAKQDRDPILAVVRGTSVNQDGASAGFTVPSREAQKQLIERTLQKANLQPKDISYMEAHGTGTELGDPIEVGGIQDAYGVGRDTPLLIGSVKSNIGHLEAASGVAGVIKVILALNHGVIPPNLQLKKLNPKIHLEDIPAIVVTEPMDWKATSKRAGISSFGYTGTNAHAILEEAPALESVADDSGTHILTLSAKTDAALKELTRKYVEFLDKTDASLGDICYTANTGRNREKYTVSVKASSLDELKERLTHGEFVQEASTDTQGKKVLLPTYPFQRSLYWIETKGIEKENLLYEWKWKEQILTTAASKGNWLMINDPQTNIATPSTKESFVELLRKEPVSGIVLFSEKNGAESFLYLIQAVVQENLKVPIRLISTENLSNSPLNGMFKTAVLEYPDLPLRLVILEGQPSTDAIMKAIYCTDDVEIIRIRENHYEVPRYTRIEKLEPKNELKIHADATYLITGGTGGLGRALAKWLIDKGAKHLVLTGRNKTADLSEFKEIDVKYEMLDVGQEKAVEELLKKLNGSLKGIFHLAGVLADATLLEQDWAHFEKVFAPKVNGSIYLDRYSKDLDYFVVFSSIASTLGNPGQSNYAAANSFMDALCEERRTKGLPAHSISWGPWADIGMAKSLVSRQERGGLLGISPQKALNLLGLIMQTDRVHTDVANINWKNYLKQMLLVPSWLELFIEKKEENKSLTEQLKETNDPISVVKDYVSAIVKMVIGLPPDKPLDGAKGFFDMGMDSLMSIEIKNRLQAGLGSDISIDAFITFNYTNIDAITAYLCHLLKIETVQEKKMQQEDLELSMDEIRQQLKRSL